MKEIHLFNLPEELRIKLNQKYLELLFKSALEKVGDGKELAKILETRSGNIYRWRNGSRLISIKTLQKLSSLLNIPQPEIERNVIAIKSSGGIINNPKLPIKICEDLGIVLASVLGDGGVGYGYAVHYTNSRSCLVDSFLSSVKNVFGEVKVLYDKIRGSRRQVWLSGVLGKILVQTFGVPRGDKTFLDYEIPKVIFESNEDILRKFLRRVFDDEGWVIKSTRSIRISTTIEKDKITFKEGPKRLLDIKILLKNLGIRCSGPNKKCERTHTVNGKKVAVEDWELNICDRKSLETFAQKVGFELEAKMSCLMEAINSYKIWKTPQNESLIFFLKNAVQLLLENGKPFSARELALKSNRTINRAEYAIQRLKEEGMIKQIEVKTPVYRGSGEPTYTVTEAGLQLLFDFK